MKKRITFAKLFTFFLAITLLISVPVNNIEAGTGAIGTAGIELDEDEFAPYELNLANKTTNIPTLTEVNAITGIRRDKNTTYYVQYEDALPYYNELLDVRVEVQFLTDDNVNSFNYNRNYIAITDDSKTRIDKNNMIEMLVSELTEPGFDHTIWTQQDLATITYKFFKDGEPYKVSLLVGIMDPDGGNYEFTGAATRNIYYVEGPAQTDDLRTVTGDIKTLYAITNDGLCRTDFESTKVNTNYPYWTNARFGIELDKEDSFSYTVDCMDDVLFAPLLYQVKKKYTITYELNGGTNDPTNPTEYLFGDQKNILPPTRNNYRFVGWTRDDSPTDPEKNESIKPDDEGNKKFIAQWLYNVRYYPNYPEGLSGTGVMPDELDKSGGTTYELTDNTYALEGYKFMGWNTKEDKTGTDFANKQSYTDLMDKVDVIEKEMIDDKENAFAVLYGKWEPIQYTVKYDPNGGTGHMDDQTPLNFNQDYNLDPNTYVREGYSWVGWNTSADKSGQDYVDKEGFRNLTTKDGDTVTMYAQWEPWKYYVKYEPNGGEGTMNPQTFLYPDPTMKSKENQFTRSGYEFIGFEFEHKGAKYIITSVKDFKDMLKELGPNSTITLVAQWRKLPDPIVKYYSLPVTGVDK